MNGIISFAILVIESGFFAYRSIDAKIVLLSSSSDNGDEQRSELISSMRSFTCSGFSPRSRYLPAILISVEFRRPSGIIAWESPFAVLFAFFSDIQNAISSGVGATIGPVLTKRYCFPLVG